MEKTREKNEVFKSIIEFEKAFFPSSFKKRSSRPPTRPHTLGVSLARQSLDAIRRQLLK